MNKYGCTTKNSSLLLKQWRSFKAPFGCLISGSSGSGKTTIVEHIIGHADKMIEPRPKAIIFLTMLTGSQLMNV